ncbi:hypothetical protein GCM10023224_18160 [Streptomonospora halophila]|uniref:Uncharacterized protein n=1 Tax=Streptomonospora halophila TaxID=427369 RepID=A0ABP9GDS8_9ACTN
MVGLGAFAAPHARGPVGEGDGQQAGRRGAVQDPCGAARQKGDLVLEAERGHAGEQVVVHVSLPCDVRLYRPDLTY